MATNPTEKELPPLPAVTKKWINEDGTPTVEFARYMNQLRRFLKETNAYIEQELP